jgi:hypothetical protein
MMDTDVFMISLDSETLNRYFGPGLFDAAGFVREMRRRAKAEGKELPLEVFSALAEIVARHMQEHAENDDRELH